MTVVSARGDYQKEAQGRLNEIEAMLNVFRSRLYVVQRRGTNDGNRKLLLLRGRKLILENILSELRTSSDRSWLEQRDRFERAADDVEKATNTALKQLR